MHAFRHFVIVVFQFLVGFMKGREQGEETAHLIIQHGRRWTFSVMKDSGKRPLFKIMFPGTRCLEAEGQEPLKLLSLSKEEIIKSRIHTLASISKVVVGFAKSA